jgi:hypothetical protein
MSRSLLVLGLALLACGPSGTLSGKVTVEGGSAASLAVLIYGPTSTAVVTKDDGTFTATSMQDGAYVVRVVVKGAEVEDQSVPATVKSGKTDVAPNLDFKIPSGKVTGKVTFTDGSDSAGLAVTLTGTTSMGATTGAGGSFSFTAVPTGAYLVTVGAPNTREGQVSVGVAVAGMASDVGELILTPVGRIGGTVTANSMPVAGATVNVAGTQLTSTTDALGAFSFPAVPAGSQTFVAHANLPVPRIASQSVMVTRGANADLALTLTDETRTGAVNGNVTFVGAQSPTIISVTVPGTNASATPGPDGSFKLNVPVGTWDVVATAPFFPKQTIGHVEVTEGNSQVLPGATLSFLEPVWTSQVALAGAQINIAPAGPWLLLLVTDTGGGLRTLIFNRTTRDARVIGTGAAVGNTQFSKTGKFLGYVINNQLFTYETATGTVKAWGVGTNLGVSTYGFSSDETVLFVSRTNSLAGPGFYFERIVLATGAVTRYPTSGMATAVYRQTSDRWYVQENSGDVTLVQPTSDSPQILTQTNTGGPGLSIGGSVLSLVGCAGLPAQCTLKVIAPTATAAVSVPGTFPTSVGYYNSFFSNQPGEWPLIYNPSTNSFALIRAVDGTLFTITTSGTSLYNVFFNPGSTPQNARYGYQTLAGGTFSMREEALPPTNPAPIATATNQGSAQYISPTRFIWFDPAAHRVIDVKSGVATVDTDVHPSNGTWLGSSIAVWSSTTKWKAAVGDSAAVNLDAVPLTQASVNNAGARTSQPVPTVGYVTFDSSTNWVVDGAAGSARRSNAGVFGNLADRWGTTEIWRGSHPYSSATWVTAGATEQVIDLENLAGTTALGPNFAGDATASAVSGKQLLLGWNR